MMAPTLRYLIVILRYGFDTGRLELIFRRNFATCSGDAVPQ